MIKANYQKVIYLVLVLVWMLTIYIFSSQNSNTSKQTSTKVTQIIIKIFTYNQNLTEEELNTKIEKTDIFVRKFAHYSIYTLGGILIYNYINTFKVTPKRKIIISILIGVIYAITDELHQYFVAGRSAQILDVCIDSLGMITGNFTMNYLKKQKILK